MPAKDAENIEKCTVVWQEVSSVNNILLGVNEINYTGYLPFFLSGDEIVNLSSKGINLESKHLLFGIFLGLNDLENRESTKFWIQNTDRDELLEILYALQKYFEKESLELMIMDIAYVIGEQNGSSLKDTVLKVGLTLLPSSSLIKAELIINSWVIVSEATDDKILENIIKLLSDVDLNHIGKTNSNTKELICFYGLCALVFLEKSEEEINSFIEGYIKPNITIDILIEKINLLMQSPDEFRPKDMRIA